MNTQWKLVPVEPTETMVINGFESEPDECFTDEEVWEQYQEMSGCQQAAFRAKLCWAAMISSSPTSPEEDAQPVMKLEAERLWGGAGEYVVSFVKPGWLDECRKTGGEFLLYTHPDAGKVARLTAERDALQLRLNAADQRIDELSAILQNAAENELPTYKPGLYAVRHIDNWDGERDVVLTFAQLDADGKWTDNETGGALLTYRGDKILRAWPLDCSAAPDTQIIGVPRNWLEGWALELVEAAQDGGQMSNQVEHLLEIHAKP
jgi:hypothetical protein